MDKNETELNEVINIIKTCPNCKAVVNGEKFCHNCGMNLEEFNNIVDEKKDEKVKFETESNRESQEQRNSNITTGKLMLIIMGCIIFVVVASFIIVQCRDSTTLENDELTANDFKDVLSREFTGYYGYLNDTYQKLEDGNGRTLVELSYGRTDDGGKSYYNATDIVMFMKKDGIVTYVMCPTSFFRQTTYQNMDDFKEKNNWGKPESMGLGNEAKTFTSRK